MDLCETGKALSPRSTIVATPCLSRISITPSGGRLWNAGFKKFDLERMCPIKSFQDFTFVKLHLPFPVIIILRPGRGIFSIRMILRPLSLLFMPIAAIRPAAPPPIIIISDTISIKKLLYLHSAIQIANATLAQSVEQLIRNEQVEGSNPLSGSSRYSALMISQFPVRQNLVQSNNKL